MQICQRIQCSGIVNVSSLLPKQVPSRLMRRYHAVVSNSTNEKNWKGHVQNWYNVSQLINTSMQPPNLPVLPVSCSALHFNDYY